MIIPVLEDIRKRKDERKKQFVEVLDQICQISNEIHRSSGGYVYNWSADESDLSLKRLEELHSQLHVLQKEKVHPALLLLSFGSVKRRKAKY